LHCHSLRHECTPRRRPRHRVVNMGHHSAPPDVRAVSRAMWLVGARLCDCPSVVPADTVCRDASSPGTQAPAALRALAQPQRRVRMMCARCVTVPTHRPEDIGSHFSSLVASTHSHCNSVVWYSSCISVRKYGQQQRAELHRQPRILTRFRHRF